VVLPFNPFKTDSQPMPKLANTQWQQPRMKSVVQ